MKIAVAFTGLFKKASESSIKSLSSSIQKLKNDHEIDCYFYIKHPPSKCPERIKKQIIEFFPDSFIKIYNTLEEDLSIKTPDACYHYTLSAFYQRYQWNQIWEIIKSTKKHYDFLIRTRPDFRFTNDPNLSEFNLWNDHNDVLYGVSKLSPNRKDLLNIKAIQDVFTICNIKVAEILMTTINRFHLLDRKDLKEKCYMYKNCKDLPECYSIYDLIKNNIETKVIEELHSEYQWTIR